MRQALLGTAIALSALGVGVALGHGLAKTGDERFAGPGWSHAPRSTDALYEKTAVIAKALSYIKNNYVEDVSESQLVYGAVRGMVATLDPHSVFMDPDELRSLRADSSGEFGGLGLELTQLSGELAVLAALDDTPAARAGIRRGDIIRAIDGHPTAGLSLDQASSRLKGAAGSEVRLSLWRPAFTAPRDLVLVRDRIRVESIVSQLLDGSVGHVRIRSFQEHTERELAQALVDLRRAAGANWKGLVLDLRDNPGGLLEQGVRVADRFIARGIIVTTRGRNGRHTEVDRATTRGTEPDYPLVVLVNAGTASAAEIVAGALQDHDRGVVLGTPTYGKASVQTIIDFDDGSGLKLTIARYYTPNGRSIQESGITPDVLGDTADDALVATEASLPGHMKNDQSNAPARPAPIPWATVVPPRKAGKPVSDATLEAGVRAVSEWTKFKARLADERRGTR